MSEQDFHDKNVKYEKKLPIGTFCSIVDVDRRRFFSFSRLLNPDLNEKYETIKQAYAEILYRWNMLNERADVLKYSYRPPERSRGIGKMKNISA